MSYEPKFYGLSLTVFETTTDVPRAMGFSLTSPSAQDIIAPVAFRGLNLAGYAAQQIVQSVGFRGLELCLADRLGDAKFFSQPLGPTAPVQTPGRMRHGLYFSQGHRRQVGPRNRRE